MKKAECEKMIRYLCSVWAREKGIPQTGEYDPSFIEFLAWMEEKYPQYLNFRITGGPEYAVQRWFDQEFKQTWKN